MDSLTQIVLGAGVGEAVLGRKAGNKALLWGAVGGTIPDLDVLFTGLYSTVDGLFVHRGFSHSIFFSLLAAPILGFMIYRIYKKQIGTWKDWSFMMFLALFTHILLDSLTSYGTGLFEPFSNARVEASTIAIVDIFYTLPFLILLLVLAFYRKESQIRFRLMLTALILSTAYLGFTAINKQGVKNNFETALNEKNIEYQKMKVQPLPLTNFLWMAVAKVENGTYIGYFSNFDGNDTITFEFLANNNNLPEYITTHPEVEKLKRFSKGFYHMIPHEQGYHFYDLRFGRMGFSENDSFIFTFNIQQTNKRLRVSEGAFTNNFSSEDFKAYINRIKGV